MAGSNSFGLNSVGFDYQGVDNVINQVQVVSDEVNQLFARIDRAIQENIGEGTTFYGKKAAEFQAAWEDAKSTFPTYAKRIVAICVSAKAARGIYSENENTGNVSQL